MSVKEDTNNTMMSCCASCGKTEGDGIQLRTCTACKSARYCSVTCQRNHRPQHKKACKMRAAELRDEILFKQPESSFSGDCPICCLPLPPDGEKYTYYACCSKVVCNGCVIANVKRLKEQRLELTCPFCRDPSLTSDDNQNMMRRVQANDPNALCQMGVIVSREGKHAEALQYFTKAAELGDVTAHLNLSVMYRDGRGVEKDEKKEVYHAEEAAIKGNAKARYSLARYETRIKGRNDRAVKHLIIAANLGHDISMQELKKFYADGHMSKEDFASALRAHHAAVDALKSPQRDMAEAMIARGKEIAARKK